MAVQIGYRVVGTIKAVKGTCGVGHKVGDQLELSGHSSGGGLCGFLYHSTFPHILTLQFGGSFPSSWSGPDMIELDCPDTWNLVTIELRRIKE